MAKKHEIMEVLEGLVFLPDKEFKKVQKILKKKGYDVRRGESFPEPQKVYFSRGWDE